MAEESIPGQPSARLGAEALRSRRTDWSSSRERIHHGREARPAEGPSPAVRRLPRPRISPALYTAAFERAVSRAQDCACLLSSEQATSGGLLSELLRFDPPRRLAVVHLHRRFVRLTLANRLTDESLREARTAPPRARELAELALAVIAQLDVRRYGRTLVRDAQARACAALGWALCRLEQAAAARAAYATARAVIAAGSGDPIAEAQIHELEASLDVAAGDLRRAHSQVAQATLLYRQADQPTPLARSLVRQALLSEACLDPDGGEVALQEALDSLARQQAAGTETALAGLAARLLERDLSGRRPVATAQAWLAKLRRDHRDAPWLTGLALYHHGRLADLAGEAARGRGLRSAAAASWSRRGCDLLTLDALLELVERGEAAQLVRREAPVLAARLHDPLLAGIAQQLGPWAEAHGPTLAGQHATAARQRLARGLLGGEFHPLSCA